jgi:hypothetical protein
MSFNGSWSFISLPSAIRPALRLRDGDRSTNTVDMFGLVVTAGGHTVPSGPTYACPASRLYNPRDFAQEVYATYLVVPQEGISRQPHRWREDKTHVQRTDTEDFKVHIRYPVGFRQGTDSLLALWLHDDDGGSAPSQMLCLPSDVAERMITRVLRTVNVTSETAAVLDSILTGSPRSHLHESWGSAQYLEFCMRHGKDVVAGQG